MDPFSQAFLGAAAAQAYSKKETIKTAAICGALGGILPDADIFIRSSSDSLLAIEFHRHFTHSIAFIPFGGFITALLCILLFKIFRKDLKFKAAYIFSILGYATHGLLDAMTSYGTHLSWPISLDRVSWSVISVVDPLFTIPMIVFVVLTHRKLDKKYLKIFTVFALIYFSIGLMQNRRVTNEMKELAKFRGHEIEHYEVKPTIGNNIVWRTVYLSNEKIYIDAIRLNWLGNIKIYEGGILEAKIFPESFSHVKKTSLLHHDLERFYHFSNNLVGVSDEYKNILIDARYSSVANGSSPMWGLDYDPISDFAKADFVNFREDFNDEKISNFISMLKGE